MTNLRILMYVFNVMGVSSVFTLLISIYLKTNRTLRELTNLQVSANKLLKQETDDNSELYLDESEKISNDHERISNDSENSINNELFSASDRSDSIKSSSESNSWDKPIDSPSSPKPKITTVYMTSADTINQSFENNEEPVKSSSKSKSNWKNKLKNIRMNRKHKSDNSKGTLKYIDLLKK